MVVAAIVEVVRLGMVRRMDLFTSTAAVPMSVFWLVPQYFIIGAAEIMVNIGTLEMFYSEVCFAAIRLRCDTLCLGRNMVQRSLQHLGKCRNLNDGSHTGQALSVLSAVWPVR